jgi:uncharacterized membrane protein YdcZ (DUF606 family)
MTDGELPMHLLYALVFGGLVVTAIIALFIELGTRTGKRRLGMMAWFVVGGLIGAIFFAINIANVLSESGNQGAG